MANKTLRFALIGSAGYVAPRHMKAIAETGNDLVAILDKNDSVGIIDSFFPKADFFLESERFDRHLDKLRRKEETKIDFVSICSPNYLHDAHIRLALRNQCNAICEKPVVLNPWNIDALQEIEIETGKEVFNILQLRLHPSIIKLKQELQNVPKDKVYDIDMIYITSRGSWYHVSWKGDTSKSGGIATNIGVHFFDMLIWLFGEPSQNILHHFTNTCAGGFLQLRNANVRWFLSIDEKHLPEHAKVNGQRTYRSIKYDGREIEFSGGFTDLHTMTYRSILNGTGFGLKDARPSIETVYQIRNAKVVGLTGDYHPFLKNLNE